LSSKKQVLSYTRPGKCHNTCESVYQNHCQDNIDEKRQRAGRINRRTGSRILKDRDLDIEGDGKMKTNSAGYDMFSQGANHFARGEYEESVYHFSKAIEADPHFHLAYMSRGAAWAKAGNIEKALEDFEKVLAMNPNDPRAYHFRGLAYLNKGDRERAKQDFDNSIELDDRYGIAYFSRGTTLSELGDMDRAGEDMKMAARIGEAHLQGFADDHNIWRTKYDKMVAELSGEREPDMAVTPDLRSFLDG
jgi:tetratricopeptide (TPR) repeat protein